MVSLNMVSSSMESLGTDGSIGCLEGTRGACLESTRCGNDLYPEEERRWMAQEVRSYVEAVLNTLAANVQRQFIAK
ncbi:putative dynamin GTPase [Helianthus annuus]|nr:putative dynamin GTPase [Helianthus annuus]